MPARNKYVVVRCVVCGWRAADPVGPKLFLGTLDKVYIVDKVENNPTKINGHPAWAAGL